MVAMKMRLLILWLVLNFSSGEPAGSAFEDGIDQTWTCPMQNGLYSFGDDPCLTVYYRCTEGAISIEECASGYFFDPLQSECSPNEYCPSLIEFFDENSLDATDTVAPSPQSTNGPTSVSDSTSTSTVTSIVTSTVMSTTQTTSNTPSTFVCPGQDGIFPASTECVSNFYLCVNGRPYPQKCGANQLFDPVRLTCTPPEQCLATTTMSTPSSEPPTTSEPPASFVCPSPNGTFPASDECVTNHYVCVGGIAYEKRCPGRLVFDPVNLNCTTLEVCLAATTVNTPSSESPTTTQPSFVCPSPDGLFPVSDECVFDFYNCTKGIARLQICPGRLYFDPIKLKCTDLADCLDSTISTDSTSTSTSTASTTSKPPSTFVCPEEDGIYASSDECVSIYYMCINENAYPQRCPANQVFDPVLLSCTSPERCLESTLSSESPTTNGPPSFLCPSPDGLFPVSDECVFDFYNCTKGIARLQICPGRLYFDPIKLICTELADCLATTTMSTPSSEPPTTSESPASFVCPSPNGTFPASDGCVTNHYVCVGGIAYEKRCPGRLVFDPVNLNCTTLEVCLGSTTSMPETSTSSSTSSTTIIPTTTSSTATSTTFTTPSTATPRTTSTSTRPTTTLGRTTTTSTIATSTTARPSSSGSITTIRVGSSTPTTRTTSGARSVLISTGICYVYITLGLASRWISF